MVTLLNYRKWILLHILDSCLPERKKYAGGIFLVQDCKMREHFGIGTKRLRFNHHAKSSYLYNKRGLPIGNPLKLS